MTTANILRMIGVGDYDASNSQANLAISICPILSGENAGSTHMVYTNDEEGMINNGKRRERNEPCVEVVRSMKRSVITWISAYLEEVHHIKQEDIYKVRRCFSIAAQMTNDDRSLRNFDPVTGHMTISERLLEPEAATSEGIENARRLRQEQGHGPDDLDLWLDGEEEPADSSNAEPLVDINQAIKLGLHSPQEETRRSASGASCTSNDRSQMSTVPASQRADGNFNIMDTLKKNTEAKLKAQTEARDAEAKAAELEKEKLEHAKKRNGPA